MTSCKDVQTLKPPFNKIFKLLLKLIVIRNGRLVPVSSYLKYMSPLLIETLISNLMEQILIC